MITPSAFSIIAKSLRHTLASNVTGLDESSILISNPKDANPLTTHNSLNLFFYRIDDGIFPADGTSDNPVYVGLNCLITAYGIEEDEPVTPSPGGDEEEPVKITPGENDLRLIGEVMRVMHERPIHVINENHQTMHLQAIRLPLNLDDINHIWSTQGDAVYRFSVAYQFSLVPVPFNAPVMRSPLVTQVGADVYPDIRPPVLPATGFAVHTTRPDVQRTVVDTKQKDWAPHICFLTPGNKLSYVLEISDNETDLDREILIAGAPGSEVEMYWEIWRWDLTTNTGSWEAPVLDVINDGVVRIPEDDNLAEHLLANVIDPKQLDLRLKHAIRIPLSLPPGNNIRLQAALYAVRKQQRLRTKGTPFFVNIRSNLLAVSVYHRGAVA